MPAVWSSRGRLFLDGSIESSFEVHVCGAFSGERFGGRPDCVEVESIRGCVVGGEHLGSRGHVMVIGIGCSLYGVERLGHRRKLLL